MALLALGIDPPFAINKLYVIAQQLSAIAQRPSAIAQPFAKSQTIYDLLSYRGR